MAVSRQQSARVEDELRRGQLDLESARALRAEAEQSVVLARVVAPCACCTPSNARSWSSVGCIGGATLSIAA